MPERNVLRVYQSERTKWQGNGFVTTYYYYAPIYQNTARAFNVSGKEDDGEFFVGIVNCIRNRDGEIVKNVGKRFRFKTSCYQSQAGIRVCAAVMPDELIRAYGVLESEFLDVTFTALDRPEESGGSFEIYSHLTRWGEIAVKPADVLATTGMVSPETLIEHRFSDTFFVELVNELNAAHGMGHTRATLLLYRVLIENLLIELLRSRFGMQEVSLFFEPTQRRFHDFSVLIRNSKERTAEFAAFSNDLTSVFFDKIDKEYRERGNAAAHRLELRLANDFFAQRKNEMNEICDALVRAIERISNRSL